MVRLIPAGTAFPCSLCLVLAETGERAEAQALLARYTDDPQAIPHSMNYWISLSHLADACALLGDAERAALLYARLLPHRAYNIVGPGCSLHAGPTEYFLGGLALAMGQAERAAEHFAAAIAACMAFGAIGWRARSELGAARAWLARGDRTRGAEHLRAALAIATASGSTAVAAAARALGADAGVEN